MSGRSCRDGARGHRSLAVEQRPRQEVKQSPGRQTCAFKPAFGRTASPRASAFISLVDGVTRPKPAEPVVSGSVPAARPPRPAPRTTSENTVTAGERRSNRRCTRHRRGSQPVLQTLLAALPWAATPAADLVRPVGEAKHACCKVRTGHVRPAPHGIRTLQPPWRDRHSLLATSACATDASPAPDCVVPTRPKAVPPAVPPTTWVRLSARGPLRSTSARYSTELTAISTQVASTEADRSPKHLACQEECHERVHCAGPGSCPCPFPCPFPFPTHRQGCG